MNTTIDVFKEVKARLDIVDVLNEVLLQPLDENLKTRCPWHNDSVPSFSVDREKQRWKCFGECNIGGDIFDFYMKWYGIDKGEALRRLAAKAGVKLENGKTEVIATYDYQDETGNILYYVDKLKTDGKKKFRGWRYAGGQKIYDIKGIRRVLYRLPELISGPDPVLILEGEKDAETARKLGYTATTSPFGAGNWRDDYSESLKDRDCVIFADNDPPGRDHANIVAKNLFNKGAKSIKIVEVPGLPEGGDISDYMDNGGTKEGIEKLIEAAPILSKEKIKQVKEEVTNPFEPQIVEGKYNFIHPALDYGKDMAITTIPLLTEIPELKESKSNGTVKVVGSKKERVNWCVTSKKEKFRLADEELSKRGYYHLGDPIIYESRWDYLNSIKPWLKGEISISPKDLFLRVENTYRRYLDYMDDRLYRFFTLWSIGTYFYPLFKGYPIVFLNGESGSGKSKTIVVTEGLSFNAINTGNISDCSIFRLIEAARCSILLDENEKVADPDEYKELINLLLAGFLKSAKVWRTETKKNKLTPKGFEVYSPKMVANIKGIKTEALKNRTIMVKMFPGKDDRQNNYPDLADPKWQRLRNDMYVFAMDHWQEIKDTISEFKGSDWELSGYFFMMWQPIFVLAKYFSKYLGEDLLDKISPLAQQKIKERKDDKQSTYNYILMRIIKELADNRDVSISGAFKFISTAEIREEFLKEIDVETDSDKASKNFSPQRFGYWIANLAIGETHKQRDPSDYTKTIRGWKINPTKLDEICQRFEIPNDHNDHNATNDL